MKRHVVLGLALMMSVLFCACGADAAEKTSISPSVSAVPTATKEVPVQKTIGFCFAGEGAFYDQLITDLTGECVAMDYRSEFLTAASAEDQESQIRTLISDGASAVVVDPVDVDSLETVLAECDTQGIPVINILDAVNGVVKMLISPEYSEIGRKAGELAVSNLGETGGACLLIKTDYDSFNMQMMTDGFNAAISGHGTVTVAAEEFCGADEEKAYQTTKVQLIAKDEIAFIFAQNAALGRGAIKAAGELGKEVFIAVYGGDMDIISAVQSGEADAALFFGPGELANHAVDYADRMINDAAYIPPQFDALGIEIADIENAASYYDEYAAYAETG